MSEQRHLVFVSDEAWRLGVALASGPVTTAADATLEARAAAIKEHLAALGDVGSSVILALPSAWCLSATVSTEGLDRSSRRRAMGFCLEEHLPIAAEDVVADYVTADDGTAMGVCAEFVKLEAIVTALEAVGLRVRHVCPAALLAAAEAVKEHGHVDAVLIGGAGEPGEPAEAGYDFVELRKGKPVRWWWLGPDAAAIQDRLSAWAATAGEAKRLALIGPDAPMRKALLSAGAVESVDMKIARDEAAARYQASAAKTGESLWVDLRCGKLAAPDRFEEYRKPLAALGAAVVLLLACLAGAMLWRGQHYAAQTRQCVQQQVRLFKEVMPNQPVPGSIKDRLGSERRKLVALGGQADEGGAAGPGQQVSALLRLRDVLKALPGQGRYRLLDLNIQPDLIRLEGQVQNHADADVAAAGWRQSGLYDVEPPKTQALKERGVGFAFTAIPRLDGGLPKAGPP
ncbi:MAG: hypothetical protein NT031_11370 [Planctomycetota bacterium]|nr:hypothetical protein [Planctomycetota bacterium]